MEDVKKLDKEYFRGIVGSVLRRYRERTDFSQERLALACGMDRTYISMIERGKRMPTLQTLFQLAPFLQVSPAELVQAIEDEVSSKPADVGGDER